MGVREEGLSGGVRREGWMDRWMEGDKGTAAGHSAATEIDEL